MLPDASPMLGYHDGFQKHAGVKSTLIRVGTLEQGPIFSIMIPTFRRPHLLREAISSALQQAIDLPFEVVVLDNEQESDMASRVDEVVDSFASPRLFLYRNEKNIGMFGNWNRCIELARGNWLTILNDDDLLTPGYLSAVAACVRGTELVSPNVSHFGSRVGEQRRRSRLKAMAGALRDHFWYRSGQRTIGLADVLIGNPVTASLGLLLNRESCLKLGGFNEAYWPSADYVFTVRYWLNFGGTVIKPRLACYRWEENESLKPETVVGFVVTNLRLRRQLIAALPGRAGFKKLLLAISAWQTRLQVSLYVEKFHLHAMGQKIFSDCGLPFRPVLKPEFASLGLLCGLSMLCKVWRQPRSVMGGSTAERDDG